MAAPLRPRYTAPVPGPMGRTDEGVDYATKPGEAIRAIGAGVIDFVGRFSGFGNYIRERLASGQEVYYAEQAQSTVKVGQRVRQGQRVGIAGSGLEVGFAQRGRNPLPQAQAEGGYSEGQVTPAGQRFRALLGGATPAQTTLGQLWINAGGDAKYANIMAAIALAESGGRVDATHKNADGSIDRGLWQVNSSHTQFDANRLVSDPSYNAQAAVRIFKGQGLGAWTTYSSGAYRQYLQGAGRHGIVGGGGTARTRPGGTPADPAAAAGQAQDIAWYDYLNPTQGEFWDPFGIVKDATGGISDIGSFFKWIAWIFHPRNILRLVEFTAGLGLFVMGIAISVKVFESPDTQGPKSTGAVRKVFESTPPGRAVRLQGARRQGRSLARSSQRMKENTAARSAAKRKESTRLSSKAFERTARATPSEEIPF